MNESVTPADDQAMAGHRKILLNSPAGHSAHSNRISTTKYTPITFVPLFLWDQFSKPANFYFLIISSLQVSTLNIKIKAYFPSFILYLANPGTFANWTMGNPLATCAFLDRFSRERNL